MFRNIEIAIPCTRKEFYSTHGHAHNTEFWIDCG